MRKRLWAGLLTLAILMTMTPVAFAAETEQTQGVTINVGKDETQQSMIAAIDNASDGDTINLTSYIKETVAPTEGSPNGHWINKNLTINLNGYEWEIETYREDEELGKVPYDCILTVGEGKTMTINGVTGTTGHGGIRMVGAAATTPVLQASKDATLNMTNVIIYAQGSSGVIPYGNAAAVNMTNCYVDAYTYGVATNATSENGSVVSNNVKITLNKCTITASDDDSTAVMLNVPGTLSIESSYLKSGRQGLIVRGGTASVKGTTIKLNDDNGDTEDPSLFADVSKYLNSNWGSGNEVPMAAVVVGNRDSKNYQYPAYCSFENCTITGAEGENGYDAIYVYGNDATNTATCIYDADSTITGKITNGSLETATVGTSVAEVDGQKYLSIKEAVAAAKTANGTVKLLANCTDAITATDRYWLRANEQLTLDLNGKTLTVSELESYYFVLNGGKLTITDSSADGAGKIIAAKCDNFISVQNQSSSLVFEKGTIELDGYWTYQDKKYGNTAVIIFTNGAESGTSVPYVNFGKDAKIVVADKSGEDMIYPGWAIMVNGVTKDNPAKFGAKVDIYGEIVNGGLYVNGTVTATENTVPEFNVYDGAKIDGQIYAAGYAKWNISGGDIQADTAMEIRAGELTITGGTLTGTAKPTTVKPNGNGGTSDGVGLAIAQHNTKLPIIVNISDGTISGFTGLLESNPQSNSATDIEKVQVNITGGKFAAINGGTNAVSSEDNRLTITGGYFTSDPSNYCGMNPENAMQQLTGIPNDDPVYKWTVGEKSANAVAIAAGAPEIKTDLDFEEDSTKKELLKAAAEKLVDTEVSGDSIDLAAKVLSQGNIVTVDDTITGQLGAVVPGVNKSEINIVIQTYMDMNITGVSNDSLTVDIQPMYRKVATTADVDKGDKIYLTKEGNNAANAVVIREGRPLEVKAGDAVTVIIPVSDTLANEIASRSDNLYVKHTKDGNFICNHKASYDTNAKAVNFVNDKGFSTFAIQVDGRHQNVQFTDKDGNNLSEVVTYDASNVGDVLPTTEAPSGKVFSGWMFGVDDDGEAFVDGVFTTMTDELLTGLNENTNPPVKATPVFKDKPSSGSSSGSTSTTYAVNVNAATNGTVAADKKTAAKGTTVTVTATPSAGYVVDAVKVVDKDGKDVAVTAKDGQYSFVMPASAVTVTATFKAETPAPSGLPFVDVKSGDWFYDAVKYAYEQGLMTGTSATTFAPNGTMNRAMIVTVLYRLEKSPAVTAAAKFTDVPAGQWYSDAVAWAAANNIVNGYNEMTFGPMNAVTREQMAAILFRYEQYKGMDNVTLEENLNRFPDKDKISAYAVPAFQWAVGQKVINGNADGTLNPTGTATRAQVAQIFTNLLNK